MNHGLGSQEASGIVGAMTGKGGRGLGAADEGTSDHDLVKGPGSVTLREAVALKHEVNITGPVPFSRPERL